MDFRKRSCKFIFVLAIPLVLALFYNQAVNRHYHVLQNGMVMEHAHPYKSAKTPGTPFQNHQHNDFEILVLAQLWVVSSLLAIFYVLSFLIQTELQTTRAARPAFFKKNNGYLHHLLRGPPVLTPMF